MVKTPKMRHSRAQRDPVTIDLGPDEVSRLDPAAATDTVAEPKEEAPQAGIGEESVAAGDGRFGRAPTTREAGENSNGDDVKPGPTVPPEASERRGGASLLTAGLAGGIVALLVAGGLNYAGLLPSTDRSAQDSVVAGLERDIATLKGSIADLPATQGADDAARQAVDAAVARIDTLAAAVDALKTDLAEIRKTPQEGGADPAVPALEARIGALESTVAGLGQPADQAAIDALGGRLDAIEKELGAAKDAAASSGERIATLEKSVDDISGKVEAQADQPRVALAIAASALKAAVERGGPFGAEAETFAAVAPDAAGLAELRALAAKGIASRQEIAASADAAADAMIAAARPVDQNAGVFDRLLASARSLVKVRPVGVVAGDGVPATVARMAAAVKADDFATALKEYETLPQGPKDAGAAFAAKLRARLDAEQMVDRALAGALKPA